MNNTRVKFTDEDDYSFDVPMIVDGVSIETVTCLTRLSGHEFIVENKWARPGDDTHYVLIFNEDGLPHELRRFQKGVFRLRVA